MKKQNKGDESLQAISSNGAYIFVWNPKLWAWNKLESEIIQLDTVGALRTSWKCGNTKSIKVGDRIFLIKLGTNPKGIIGSGYAASTPYYQKWNDENKDSLFIDIDFEVLINPNKETILLIDILKTGNLAKQHSWTPQASGISIKPEIIDELEAIWFDFLRTQGINRNPFIDDAKDNKNIFVEGNTNQILQTRYERNPFARKACINHFGYSCAVCNFNFEKHYGHLGKNFIHVHHLTSIASASKPYEIDPIKDLRPVCPNCHAMLHKQNPPLAVNKLKGMINEQY